MQRKFMGMGQFFICDRGKIAGLSAFFLPLVHAQVIQYQSFCEDSDFFVRRL
jgi:hypothetical protein